MRWTHNFVAGLILMGMSNSLHVHRSTRRNALKEPLKIMIGIALTTRPAYSLDLTQQSLELWRIWQQQSADASLGGELADPTGRKTLSPVLALLPIIQLRLTLDEVGKSLQDRDQGWSEALRLLSDSNFSAKKMKQVFNRYADNIYIDADSARANAYLDGGAVPTSKETTQYLVRNEIISRIDELTAELVYQMKNENASDSEDLFEMLDECKKGFDEYFKLTPQRDLDAAYDIIKMNR